MATDSDPNPTGGAGPARSARWRDRFPALARLGGAGRSGRIRFVQQLSITECGAACLSMVLGYHGQNVGVAEIREVSGVSRDGTNAKEILQAARWFRLRARGISVDVDQLAFVPPASILHWGFSHFVVFERLRGGGADIVDPAMGRRHVSMDELRRQFTGVVLLFEPGEGFEPQRAHEPRLWRYIRQVLAHTGHLPRILLVSLLLQIFALAVPIFTTVVVDRVVPRQDEHLLLVLGVGLLGLVIFYFLSILIRAHLLIHLRTLLDVRMTLDFLDHLVKLPYSFFQRRSTGDLLARVNSNRTIREIFASGALAGVLDGALIFLYLGLLLWGSWRIGLLVLALTLLQVTVFVLTRRRLRELMSKNLHLRARADSYLVELLSGIETLKVTGSEQRAVERWTDLFVDVLNSALEQSRLDALIESLASTLRLVSPLCVLGYGAVLVLDGDLTLGTMLGLSAMAVGFFVPLSNLMGTAGQFQLLGSYLERLDDVLELAPEQDQSQRQPAPALRGRVELEHVSFRYGPFAPMVVEDVSLAVEPGQFVAIVGRSGSGKSTLAGLLVGLYLPVSGRIRYDGIDLDRVELHSLRQQVSVVSQRPYLFGTTIRANIAFADPALPLDRVEQAARTACIHDEISAMPLGYDTPLTDAGASLSGGQQQRIALARAVVAGPRVLILDEATSALDAITEARVQQSLSTMQCTRIVIAHRLSTVVHADRIVVMDAGRVVEQGTHHELLRQGGIYAQLVAGQRDEDQPAPPA